MIKKIVKLKFKNQDDINVVEKIASKLDMDFNTYITYCVFLQTKKILDEVLKIKYENKEDTKGGEQPTE